MFSIQCTKNIPLQWNLKHNSIKSIFFYFVKFYF